MATVHHLRAPALIAIIIFLGACPSVPQPTALGPPKKTVPATQHLTILAFNDFHGHLDARPLRSQETPPRQVLVGGAEALAATVAELRAADPDHTLLLDGGDFMQGTLLSNHFEGAPVGALLRALAVDATVIGNHEFDFGPVGPAVTAQKGEDPRGALIAWARKVPFPLLSANIFDKKTGKPVTWPNVRPSLLLHRGGITIGIVGLTTTDTPTTTLPSNVRDLRFAKLTPILIHEARKLRARGAQVIIALAHVGGSCTTRKAESCHGELFDTVRAIPRGLVDAVIAGHSHQCVWHRVNGILISEACAKGVAVGRIELVLHNGRVNAAESQIYPPTPVCHQVFADGTCEVGLHTGPAQGPLKDNPLLARHARVVAKIRAALTPYRRKVHAKEARVLAHLARPLRHRYRGGSEVGYLFAKMLRGAIPKADVALVNAGGIRGSLGAGPVTYKDLFGVFPFDNRVAFVDVTGAQLHSLLRASLSRTHAGILQASGLHVRVRCSDPPQVLTVTDAAGKSLNPKKIYRVVFSDFMLSGGDGLSSVLKKIPENHKHIAPNRLIREEMVRFLLHLGDKPLNTRLQPVLPPTAPSVKVVGTCSAGRSRGHTRHHPLCR